MCRDCGSAAKYDALGVAVGFFVVIALALLLLLVA
jgi:hypothetical protein